MEPYIVRFPEYTKDDTLKILQLDFTPSHVKIGESDNEEGDSDDIMEEESVFLDHEFYLGFLEVIYSIFNHNCKDINELRYFAALLFPLYIKPIESGRGKNKQKT
jgi:origin recognition complex subunit 5